MPAALGLLWATLGCPLPPAAVVWQVAYACTTETHARLFVTWTPSPCPDVFAYCARSVGARRLGGHCIVADGRTSMNFPVPLGPSRWVLEAFGPESDLATSDPVHLVVHRCPHVM